MFVFQPWARLNEDLFVSQRFDRIQRRRAAGARIPAQGFEAHAQKHRRSHADQYYGGPMNV
jgi:hypothetical protein